MNPETRTQRDFFRVVTWSSALAFGFLVASALSVKRGAGGLMFDLSFRTVLAFLAGAGLAWGYWAVVLASRKSKLLVVCYSVLMCVVGIFCFLYPIQFVAKENMRDLIEGLIKGVIALTLVGFALWKTIQAFERSS